ncbi:MAG: hypothetical protein KAR01_03325 [Desulfocapsa sp.]|nr:hypothetical protein [Desulfocapsa sp.]
MYSCCQVCGNEIDSRTVQCPYCGSDQESDGQGRVKLEKKVFYQKTVNLEQGLPTVAQALNRLQQEVQTARNEQISVLTLIHGYGSTGKGGAIRLECRKTLKYLKSCGQVGDVIAGEDFNRRNGNIKQLLSRFPELTSHPHLNNHNKGITLVILS